MAEGVLAIAFYTKACIILILTNYGKKKKSFAYIKQVVMWQLEEKSM